jgi:hypothetical protein
MYVEEYLVRERHQERLKRAEEAQLHRQIVERRRLEKRRQRAERRLLHAWQRVDELRSMLEATSD